MENTFIRYLKSPVGPLRICTDEEAVLSVSFSEKQMEQSYEVPEIMEQAILQLSEYFKGSRKIFDLRLSPAGSEFQQKVWKLIAGISFGDTATYLDIARLSGSEKNTRAVGLANGKNPLPIIVPCHRIIGSDGKLTGYAGGLDRKRWLLRHELENSSGSNRLF